MTTSSHQNGTDILLYKTDDGEMRVQVRIEDETVWLTQDQMSTLFNRSISTISEHISHIFAEGELDEKETIRSFGNSEIGSGKPTKYYNLDVIISVGYRVKSLRGTQFRKWATKRLQEYIIKGFTMDDERLKQGTQLFGKDYFEELLERIRAIRASERRMYQKITDIFADCSIYYDPKSQITHTFYATVQNKFHYAITGQTAAEIIVKNADAAKPHMGLQTWKQSPKGRILKSDASVAKNYLTEEKIKKLERLVSMYFDYTEGLITKYHVLSPQA